MTACPASPEPVAPHWSGLAAAEMVPEARLLPGPCHYGGGNDPYDRAFDVRVGNVDGLAGFDIVLAGAVGPAAELRVYSNVLATNPGIADPAATIAPAGSTVAHVADVNGDGLDDIAVPHSEAFTSDWLDVYLSPVPQGNRDPEDYDLRILRSWEFGPIAALDFDRKGKPELATVDAGVFLVFAPVFDITPRTLPQEDAVARVEADSFFDDILLVADLTADGDPDVLLIDDHVGKVIVNTVQLTAFVDDVAAATLSSSSKTNGRAFDAAVEPDAGDVDGDGATDLFYQTSSDRYLGVAPGPFVGDVDLDTRTAAVIDPYSNAEVRDIALGDLDGDGFDDLLITVDDDFYDRDLLWLAYGPVEGTWTLNLDPSRLTHPDDPETPPDSAILVFPDAAARIEPLVAGDFVGDDADEVLVGYCSERDDGPNAWLIGGTPF